MLLLKGTLVFSFGPNVKHKIWSRPKLNSLRYNSNMTNLDFFLKLIFGVGSHILIEYFEFVGRCFRTDRTILGEMLLSHQLFGGIPTHQPFL